MRDAFFDEVHRIAARDPEVIFLTADMGALSLDKFKAELPDQYVNVGVAEQNLVSVAAGLALGGKKVFIYSIAPFVTQRNYEQIKVDLSGMHLPVTIVGSGPGITYGSDGPTHHAIQDVAIMRALPGMTILTPSDSTMAAAAARIGYKNDGPTYVRIDKGKPPLLYEAGDDFAKGMALLKEGRDVVLVATGIMVPQAFKVAEELAKHSVDAGILDLYRIKPIDEALLLKLLEGSRAVVTIEEHSVVGGVGSAVVEIMADNGKNLPVQRIGIPEENCPGYGDREWMHSCYGLHVEGITRRVLGWLGTRSGQASREGSSKNPAGSKLALEDFARCFGTTVEEIPNDCREYIARADFRYQRLAGEERDRTILGVLKKIESDTQIIGAPERWAAWERGWQENLRDFSDGGYDLSKLVPKFIRSGQAIRLDGDYVMPLSADFELDCYSVYRLWLFRKYLSGFDSIYEFGCGTGFNLALLAQLFPGKRLYGLDFVPSSVNLVNKLREVYHWNISGHLFDMLHPDESFKVDDNSAICTIGAVEQLASKFEPFLQFLLKRSPSLCLHVEPTIELYDENNLVDYLAMKFHRKRGYTENFLSRLRELEAENRVEILKVKRPFFGSLYMEGYPHIVWRPRKGA
ncbi:MAG: hypothetical protein HY673_18000 [Chloroflexi bacterium]|nr:hypothetical protein [Chloroflexota bacterium]